VGTAGRLPRGYAKIGDDVALVPVAKGMLALKVDMLVEHTDVPQGMSYRQAARKAVAMCVSDFAAKGVRPDSFMVSLGLRRGVSQELVDDLAAGLRDAEREWGLRLVGGDTNEAKELVVDCAMVGSVERVVPRTGAMPGDALVTTGYFGYPPSGLRILQGAAAEVRFGRRAKASVLRPDPDLKVGLALAPYLTSAMDSSDGLARSLHTLAEESGVGFEVMELPIASGVRRFAEKNGLDPEKLVFEGGEEYLIVGTMRKSKVPFARSAAEGAGGMLLEIGRTTSKSRRVDYLSHGKRRPVRDVGWTHLG
jgi:thiamine-monophosphate kinase